MFGLKTVSKLLRDLNDTIRRALDMSDNFPFSLDDIRGWIIKRKDGIIVRYTLTNAQDLAKTQSSPNVTVGTGNWFTSKKSYSSFSDWCDHCPDPANPPVFQKDGIALYIADAPGARKSYSKFDVAIDGGNALTVAGEHDLPFLFGDPMFNRLNRFVNKTGYKPEGNTKILKIRWYDRAAPPVAPTFWPNLLAMLQDLRKKENKERLNVLTICQGGHGRSGSALVALMMCLEESYTPLDALTHIRALHCARAIESKEQHEYLNELAKLLKREPDALDAEEVKSFKARLLAEDKFAQVYKDQVSTRGAKVETREARYL